MGVTAWDVLTLVEGCLGVLLLWLMVPHLVLGLHLSVIATLRHWWVGS